MYFLHFGKQNEAKVWPRFQRMLKRWFEPKVLYESKYLMPWVRCAFGNVSFNPCLKVFWGNTILCELLQKSSLNICGMKRYRKYELLTHLFPQVSFVTKVFLLAMLSKWLIDFRPMKSNFQPKIVNFPICGELLSRITNEGKWSEIQLNRLPPMPYLRYSKLKMFSLNQIQK